MSPNIVYKHPSVSRLKTEVPYVVTMSLSGLGTTTRPINFEKSREAPNGATPTKDVKSNNIQGMSIIDTNLSEPISILSEFQGGINLPPVTQTGPVCQIIPMMHAIQHQLDFPMDYNQFLNCLPKNPNSRNPFGNQHGNQGNTAYDQLYYLINTVSNKCYPVGKKPCAESEPQTVSVSNDPRECQADGCTPSVRLSFKKLNKPNNFQSLKDMLDKLGPLPTTTNSNIDGRRLTAAYDTNTPWNEVKDLDDDALDQLFENDPDFSRDQNWGHALTITGYDNNGNVELTNSWGSPPQKITMPYSDFIKHFKPPGDKDKDQPELGYYPVVTKCRGIDQSSECKRLFCIKQGYDDVKENADPDKCECDCNTLTDIQSATGIGDCLFFEVKKVYNPKSKRCECPDDTPAGWEYDSNCCLKFLGTSWCETKWCEETQELYRTGNCIEGTDSQYTQALRNNEGAFGERYTPCHKRNFTCTKETMPRECSGSYDAESMQNFDNFNIISPYKNNLIKLI